MAADTQVVRGNVVSWVVTFYDKDSNPIDPASANLTIRYQTITGGRASATVTLSPVTGHQWDASWDTGGVADLAPGIAYWSAESVTPHAATDGEIMITANPANVA